MPPPPPLIADPELVTPAWLTDVLRHGGAIGADTKVASFDAEFIGTGQVGANVRYTLAYDTAGPAGPATIVCKFASRNPESAAAGVATRTYETEVAFYRDLADTVEISRPRCYFAELRPGTADVVLVMEDLAPAQQGDQISGCSVEQATLAIDEAARLHGPRWGDPTLGALAWLQRNDTSGGLASMFGFVWDRFVDRYRATIEAVTLDAGEQLKTLTQRMLTHTPSALTPVHSDYRLDNMLFGTDEGGRPLTVVDWQTVQIGVGPSDVAYFLGSAFEPDVRRSCERDLVARYHRALVEGYGVEAYSFDECWSDYVRSSYSCMLMAVFASMLVGRTDRGDKMFMAMANRSAQMAVDLDAPSVIQAG